MSSSLINKIAKAFPKPAAANSNVPGGQGGHINYRRGPGCKTSMHTACILKKRGCSFPQRNSLNLICLTKYYHFLSPFVFPTLDRDMSIKNTKKKNPQKPKTQKPTSIMKVTMTSFSLKNLSLWMYHGSLRISGVLSFRVRMYGKVVAFYDKM